MSVFNGKRLTNKTFKLDIERMRRGWYSDKYFETIGRLLTEMSRRGYRFEGHSPRALPVDPTGISIGAVSTRPSFQMSNAVCNSMLS